MLALRRLTSLTQTRFYSSGAKLADIVAANTKITLTSAQKEIPPNNQLVFGATFADHMLEVNWNNKSGWEQPQIHPYGNLSISPSATVFHYGLECFEGMKA
ncbi:hypothetical protein BDR26DRAFT_691106 [Obelidium mucronatum]|nr:hypothetical protein BDR26DRAFT_691106 [Obelidium mucronatum]